MPTFTRPPVPTIVFNVWDRLGRPVMEADRTTGIHNVGWKIQPSYYTGSSRVFPSREACERHLPSELDYHERRLRFLMIEKLDLPTLLPGLEISRIEHVSCVGYHIHLVRGGYITVHFKRQYWQTASVIMPETGPFVVKRMLKTGKTIRLENGETITLRHYGPLRLDNVPDWLLEELFDD